MMSLQQETGNNTKQAISSKKGLSTSSKWFIFYTFPKSEKKVECILNSRGYETYLPCKQVIRQWHDRKKKQCIPLFPNYIFVRTEANKLYYIKEAECISSFVKFRNKPAVISDDGIEKIKKMVEFSEEINTTNEIQLGDCVKIIDGPLSGLKGTVLKRNNLTEFSLYIKELKQYLSIQIEAKYLELCI